MQDQTPNIHPKEPATAPSLRTAARGHAGPVVPSIHLFKRGQTLGFLGRVCVCMKSPHSNGWDAINSLWAARLGLTVPQGWRRR